jgi:hypothetical protein
MTERDNTATQLLMQEIKANNPRISDVRLLELLGLPTGDRGLLTRYRNGSRRLKPAKALMVIQRSHELHGKIIKPEMVRFVGRKMLGKTWQGSQPNLPADAARSLQGLSKAVQQLRRSLHLIRNEMRSLAEAYPDLTLLTNTLGADPFGSQYSEIRRTQELAADGHRREVFDYHEVRAAGIPHLAILADIVKPLDRSWDDELIAIAPNQYKGKSQ